MPLPTAYVAGMGRTIARRSARLLVVAIVGLGFLMGSVALADQSPISSRLPLTLASEAIGVTVVVESGDHLWKISDRHLQATMGHNPTSREILPYWRKVIETNRPTLRSGDPDLIYPGEVVRLPAVSELP